MSDDKTYKEGYDKGVEDAAASTEKMVTARFDGSQFTRGYNDGFNGLERACPGCSGMETGGETCDKWKDAP